MLVFLQIAIVSYTYFVDILKEILSAAQIGLPSPLALVSLKQSNSIQSQPVNSNYGTLSIVFIHYQTLNKIYVTSKS